MAAAAAPGGGSIEALRTTSALELTADGTGSVVLAPPPLREGNRRPLRIARVAVPNCGGAWAWAWAWAWACGGPASDDAAVGTVNEMGRDPCVETAAVAATAAAASSATDGRSIPGSATPTSLGGLAPRCEVSSSGGGVDSDALGARGITGRAPGIMAAGLNLRFEASAATPPPPARLLTSEEPTCCGGPSSPSLSLLLSPLLSLLSAGGLGGGGGAIARGGPGEGAETWEAGIVIVIAGISGTGGVGATGDDATGNGGAGA